ncbi:metallophosphoesterase [Streptomyces sp. NEAU-Y11]|uniref:metallophosphoesterase n=1 Tax=Streptomyces cucumeris TaxID=2962890 RepID=UPI0020C834E2|nr:metallophosphoesterase [Streptomyces sp. NEAU-Y11]MCP9209099.1 metallophosphoesterase [Streptomyces sp. NEAU-Y11]
MVVLFVLIALAVVGLLAGVHRYLWVRLIRDTTALGGLARRAGTAAAVALPLTTVGALVAGRAGAPFALQRVLAWPGYLWLALLLYLTLALLLGEALRPLLLRAARPRAGGLPAGAAASGTPGGPEGPGALRDVRTPRVPDAGAAPCGSGGGGEPSGEQGRAVANASEAVAAAGSRDAGGLSAGAAASGTAGDPGDPGDPGGSEGLGVPRGARASRVPDAGVVSGEPGGSDGVGEASGGSGAAGAVDAPSAVVSADDGVPGGPEASAAAGEQSRRLFVARGIAVGATAVAAGTVAYGAATVFRGPRVKRVTVPLAKLPRRAHGFRIAVVSDIHLGPILGRAHTRRVVETINRTNPDLIAVVGDLVDGSVADLGPAAEPLRELRSRHGSFFVTGNHEYFSGARQWVDHVRELGLHPLENARTELPGFDLAGVNDVAGEDEGEGPDFERALGDRDRSRASVLLAHQPVVIHDAVDHGVDLQLSGHTHGGQMWPGDLVAALANPTVAGLERYGDTQLYVTRGAGAWGPPVRVGAPPDVTVVELASRHA